LYKLTDVPILSGLDAFMKLLYTKLSTEIVGNFSGTNYAIL